MRQYGTDLDRGKTEEGGGLHVVNDLDQVGHSRAGVVLAGEDWIDVSYVSQAMRIMGEELTFLVLSKFATCVINETLRIDQIDAFAGFVLREALELEEAHQLHSDTDTSRPGAKEEDAVVSEGAAGCSGRQLRSVHEAGENDGSSALDVIVEERVTVTEGR